MKQQRQRSKALIQSILSILSILFIIISLTSKAVVSTEIKWTDGDGNEGNDNTKKQNAPYSQNYRNKVIELEQVILSSSNPQETLMKIAEDNKMTPEQLVGLIQESKGEGGGIGTPQQQQQRHGPPILSTIIQSSTTMLLFMYKYALTKPKQFTMILGLLYLFITCIVSYPKNGIVFSNRPVFGISNGHTTIFQPPPSYLQHYVHQLSDQHDDDRILHSFPQNEDLLNNVINYEYDLLGLGLGLIDNNMKYATIIKGSDATKHNMKTILHSSHITSLSSSSKNNKEAISAQLLFTSASQVMSSYRFTEFCSSSSNSNDNNNSLSLCNSASHDNYLLLALSKLGDFYRYGMQSFYLIHDEEEDGDGNDDNDIIHTKTMIFSTLSHGHLDGYLRFKAQVNNKHELIMSTTYFQPKKCRKVPKTIIKKLLPNLSFSIAQTIQLDYQQKITRGSFSKKYKKSLQDSYHGKKKRQAKELKELEEMVRERKKRWSNPNAGAFRPSGRRTISPNHC